MGGGPGRVGPSGGGAINALIERVAETDLTLSAHMYAADPALRRSLGWNG